MAAIAATKTLAAMVPNGLSFSAAWAISRGPATRAEVRLVRDHGPNGIDQRLTGVLFAKVGDGECRFNQL